MALVKVTVALLFTITGEGLDDVTGARVGLKIDLRDYFLGPGSGAGRLVTVTEIENLEAMWYPYLRKYRIHQETLTEVDLFPAWTRSSSLNHGPWALIP